MIWPLQIDNNHVQPAPGVITAGGYCEHSRDSPWMHYSIAQPSDVDAARVFKDTLAWLAKVIIS